MAKNHCAKIISSENKLYTVPYFLVISRSSAYKICNGRPCKVLRSKVCKNKVVRGTARRVQFGSYSSLLHIAHKQINTKYRMVSGITIAPTRSQNSRSSSTQQIPENDKKKYFDFRQFSDEASLNAELKACSRCSDWGDGVKKCERKEKLTGRQIFGRVKAKYCEKISWS